MKGTRIEVYNSVGGSAFFRRLLGEWEDAGAGVVRVEAMDVDQYRSARGGLARLGLRWRMYPGYGWQCWRAARRAHHAASLRVVTSNPFFAPALVARSAAGRGATINVVYDVFPEALVLSGALRRGSFGERLLASLARYALRESTATVFLGHRLREHTEKVLGPARRAVVLPVGADGSAFTDTPPRRRETAIARILYCGQLGHMHDTATLRRAWEAGGAAGLNWCFHASGAGYALLRASAPSGLAVTWGAPLDDDAWTVALLGAEVALVTMAPGAERVVMPSKTYSSLVAGQAILAIAPKASDLADLVRRHDCGWVVEPGDVPGLRRALAEIRDRPDELFVRRCNAYRAGHQFYEMGVVARAWMELFAQIAGDRVDASASRLETRVPNRAHG